MEASWWNQRQLNPTSWIGYVPFFCSIPNLFFSSQSHGGCCNDTPKSAQHSSSEVSLALFCLSLVLKEPVVVLKWSPAVSAGGCRISWEYHQECPQLQTLWGFSFWYSFFPHLIHVNQMLISMLMSVLYIKTSLASLLLLWLFFQCIYLTISVLGFLIFFFFLSVETIFIYRKYI